MATRSFQWMALKSPEAPAYRTSWTRGTCNCSGGSVSPTDTVPKSMSAAIRRRSRGTRGVPYAVQTAAPSLSVSSVRTPMTSFPASTLIESTYTVEVRLVAGDDRPMVDEALVQVHHPGEIQAERGIEHHRVLCTRDDGDREGRGGNEVRVAGRLRGHPVVVHRIVVTDRQRELANALATDGVGAFERKGPSDERLVHGHQ